METGKRDFKNIRKQYFRFLFPAIITQLAVSLSEFVDSIVVANLLDSAALSVVSMGSCVAYVFSTVYVLLGVGGSTVYSEYLGRHERKQAEEVFSVSLFCAVLAGVMITVFGILFSDAVSGLIGAGSGLEEVLSGYLKVLCMASLPVIVTSYFGYFFPAAGFPGFATAVSVTANALNLVFDVVYIRFFHMGVEGAALATFTGFAAGFLATSVFYLKKSGEIGRPRWGRETFEKLLPVLCAGAPAAATQCSYAIKVAFCNRMAAFYAGESGIVAFTVCMQPISMISVFIAGAFSTLLPFLGVFSGMNDRKGSRYVIRISACVVGTASLLMVLLFELFPQILTWMYAVTDPHTQELTLTAIRIFVTVILVRWAVLEFRNVAVVQGLKTYALLVSFADGFVFVVLLALALCPVLGITGLWWAYTGASALLLILIVLVNRQIVRRSEGKYAGFWLVADSEKVIADLTVEEGELSSVTEGIEKICRSRGIRMADAMLAAVSVEEMCLLTKENAKGKEPVRMDVLIAEDGEDLTVDFRSTGAAFDPTKEKECRTAGSLWLLGKISEEIRYDYVLGMNTVKITVRKASGLP